MEKTNFQYLSVSPIQQFVHKPSMAHPQKYSTLPDQSLAFYVEFHTDVSYMGKFISTIPKMVQDWRGFNNYLLSTKNWITSSVIVDVAPLCPTPG
jgi:hypothetical protein